MTVKNMPVFVVYFSCAFHGQHDHVMESIAIVHGYVHCACTGMYTIEQHMNCYSCAMGIVKFGLSEQFESEHPAGMWHTKVFGSAR